MRQIPLPIGPSVARSFDNYLPGANEAALAHLKSLRPGAAPVYLWGDSGSGKSHLLQAAVEHGLAEGRRAALVGADLAWPWALEPDWSLLAIDDCERLDARQQHAAFTLFVEAVQREVPVIAAGAVPPVDLPVREDLRTRLGWGLVFALHPLGESEVRDALRREARRRGVGLTDEVLDYLLTRFARDLKHLMAQLDRLDRFSLATQRAITVPLLKQMLVEEGGA